jgi:RNA polymerase sigma factor (sigma-70 family)
MAERTGTALGRALLRAQSDARLVALTRDGHDAAYEEIVRRYRPRLVRQAAAVVSADRAEDVVQESLTRALAALRSGDAEIALAPWLATIVRNRSLNELRDAPPAHEPLDDRYDGVAQPPQVAAEREEVRDVVLAISALPPEQRRALVGRELEGLSHAQIATELGVTAGAARGLIFRARAGLREALGALIPLPIVRFLMEAGAAEATGGAAAGVGAAAAGAGAGGGMKAAVGVLAVLATVGSGVAIERNLADRGNEPSSQAQANAGPGNDARGPSSGRGEDSPITASSTDGNGNSGPGGDAPGRARGDDDEDEGEGSDRERDGDDSGEGGGPGHGGGGDREDRDDRSGPGGGGSAPDDDHSGPGGGGEELDEPEEPDDPDDDSGSSGPGGGGHGGSSGSGSGGEDEPEEPDEDE